MRFRLWKNRVLLGLPLIFVVLAAAEILPNLLGTYRVMSRLSEAVHDRIDTASIVQTEIQELRKGKEIRALVYRPQTPGPKTVILFIPGLTPNGILNPRFVAVARALAGAGYVVLTPWLSGFDRFRLEEEAVEEIAFWYRQVREKPWFETRKAGIVGISVGGTLALLAASRQPECRDLDFLASIGGYQSLARCTHLWLSKTSDGEKHGRFPVNFYGKWILMLTALDQRPGKHPRLEEALTDLLESARTDVPPSQMPPEEIRWLDFAMDEKGRDQDLREQITRSLADQCARLSPDHDLSAIRCPVFLVHGVHDSLIPAAESRELERRLTSAPTVTLFTPVISHTHPLLDKMDLRSKSVALAEAALFLYRFVRET